MSETEEMTIKYQARNKYPEWKSARRFAVDVLAAVQSKEQRS